MIIYYLRTVKIACDEKGDIEKAALWKIGNWKRGVSAKLASVNATRQRFGYNSQSVDADKVAKATVKAVMESIDLTKNQVDGVLTFHAGFIQAKNKKPGKKAANKNDDATSADCTWISSSTNDEVVSSF